MKVIYLGIFNRSTHTILKLLFFKVIKRMQQKNLIRLRQKYLVFFFLVQAQIWGSSNKFPVFFTEPSITGL